MTNTAGVTGFFQRLWDVIYPRWCLGCGIPDQSLCPQCRRQWNGPWWHGEADARFLVEFSDDGGQIVAFPVWGKANYAGDVARAIVGWKHIRDRRADREFCALMAENATSLNVSEAFPAAWHNRLVVVPVASGRRRRRDGHRTTEVLAQSVAHSWGCAMVDGLRSVPCDGAGESVRDRSGKIRGQRAVRDFSGCDVILVDDVLTTGATLRGAQHAIAAAGGRVVGGLVLAITPPR